MHCRSTPSTLCPRRSSRCTRTQKRPMARPVQQSSLAFQILSDSQPPYLAAAVSLPLCSVHSWDGWLRSITWHGASMWPRPCLAPSPFSTSQWLLSPFPSFASSHSWSHTRLHATRICSQCSTIGQMLWPLLSPTLSFSFRTRRGLTDPHG